MVLVPQFVPQAFISMYLPAIYAGLIVGFIGTMAIAINRREIHILILTDLVGLAMIFVVSAVGTDLAEALILPGLVVELAETLAISEILLTREMRKIEQNPRRNLTVSSSMFPQSFSLDMEIMTTAPNFIALVLIGYGIFLTGFTGGAVAGGGIVLYALSKKARGLPVLILDGIAGVSGIAWCLWIIGFLLFFVTPQYWLLSLFLAACGLLLKVASKVGLIGLLMREDIDKE
ncbi:MAG: EhaG family protein [Methanobrevibacter sp.]|nr:EhaG family protein [Methanobrevibacter sp.]